MHSAAEDQVVDFQPHRAVWEEVEEQRQGATGSKRQLAGTNGGQAHAGSAAADVSAAAVAHHSDDELFWDYGATPTTQLSAGSAPVNLQVWSFSAADISSQTWSAIICGTAGNVRVMLLKL